MNLPPLSQDAVIKLLTGLLLTTLLIGGCAVTPEAPVNLTLRDTDLKFPVDTIISTRDRSAVSFEEMLTDLKKVRVVFVGEVHDHPAHHEIQARLVQAIHARHPHLTVGMEMFDHRYDPVLAQWTAGDLDRDTFIQKTHWYVRCAGWRFDFELYAPIFETIRDNQIRLVGLNIPGGISSKISKSGLDNLLPDDRRMVADDIDLENAEHRAYVEETYNAIPHHQAGSFEHFYEAQCAWEDTMAESIVRKMGDEPMVVLIGNGHIIRKYGVPDRVYTRSPIPLRTVYLASVGAVVDWDYADYIWVTPAKTAAGE